VERARADGAFAPALADAMVAAVDFTTDDAALAGADLVIEAATEDVTVKRRVFARLEAVCRPDAVLASNSSHLTPEEIFAEARHRGRTLVIHYFFPAERNPLVEIVAGADTDPALVGRLLAWYEGIGKVPIPVRSRYGYAVDPVFEGVFLAAALAVEEGLGTTREVDAVARRALGLGVGPFTAMNLTGGNPITDHGLEEMQRRLSPWFRSPRLMKDAIAAGRPWDVPRRDEPVSVEPAREARIADAMRGACFGLAGQILDSGIVTLADLEMALELGLVIAPPFEMMNRIGPARALELVEVYARAHPGFAVPACLTHQAALGTPFRIEQVLRRDEGDVAVLTIRRPRVLNALSGEVYTQLHDHFRAIGDDPAVRGAVLTGFGPKAFVSGADVNFLAGLRTPEEGRATSAASKAVGNLIAALGKPVVCAMNGYAIGGGNELAMCCGARIVRKGLAMAVSQPEVNLGIIPGAGGTQRLPRLVGIERAAELLRTGRPLSGAEAVERGLIREEVDGDVVAAGVALVRAAARGTVRLEPLDPSPMVVPAALPQVEIGHRSRAIDAILCRAILEGCRLPLAQGLELESTLFGECCRTEDMRIGLETFVRQGPRARAAFVHQ
jgi:enoyl-CoA hydratase/3-hydroxyacyl-CoA dehydrogenase